MEIVTCAEMKELEKKADAAGLSFYQMMENAGVCATLLIMGSASSLLGGGRAVIFCGKGNNGGDGLVVARRLAGYGNEVTVVLTSGDPKTEDAIQNFQLIQDQEHITITRSLPDLSQADVIVDAIYGTGFHGELRDDVIPFIEAINQAPDSGKEVIALDIPSGLSGDVDEYDPIGFCVRATKTITFHARKPIHNNKPAARMLGEVTVADIGIGKALTGML